MKKPRPCDHEGCWTPVKRGALVRGASGSGEDRCEEAEPGDGVMRMRSADSILRDDVGEALDRSVMVAR